MSVLREILSGATPDEATLCAAHRASIRHRALVEGSGVCACFHCLATFAPAEIADWTDGGDTALCPRCGIDAVIGDASGAPLGPAFLQAMQLRWFDGA